MWVGVGAGRQRGLDGSRVDDVADLVDEDDVAWKGAGVLRFRFERRFRGGADESERGWGCKGAGREGDGAIARHEGGVVDDARLCHRRWAGAVLEGWSSIGVGKDGRCGWTALAGW